MAPNKRTVLITTCDSYPGYRYAQWALKYRDHFNRVICAATDKSSELMRDLGEMGAELVEYDLKNEDELKKLFGKADYVHVIPPLNHDCAKAAVCMLRACGEAGVEWVVLCSIVNCDKGKGRRLRELHEIEEEGKRVGVKNLCICREGFTLERLFAFSEEMRRGKLPLPTRQGRFAPVSLDDSCHGLLRAIMKKMSGEQHGKVHVVEFTGRRMVDARTLAEEASKRLNMRVSLEDVSLERTEEIMRRHMKKTSQSVIDMMIEVFELIREGHYEKQTDDLEKMLGTEPMSVGDFFEKNEREFKS